MSSRRRQTAARRRNKLQGSGSPPAGEPEFLLVGRLRHPHGVKGEVLLAVMTDFPERIQPEAAFFLGDNYLPVTLASVRQHNKGKLVRFEGYETREDVDGLQNKGLFVRAEDLPNLPEGEYYQHQLVGLQVVSDQGQVLGTVRELIETGANDVFVVHTTEGKELLLPDIEEVILDIDLEKKIITVHLLEGLIE
jgi:16S rRNA processing protein RimM